MCLKTKTWRGSNCSTLAVILTSSVLLNTLPHALLKLEYKSLPSGRCDTVTNEIIWVAAVSVLVCFLSNLLFLCCFPEETVLRSFTWSFKKPSCSSPHGKRRCCFFQICYLFLFYCILILGHLAILLLLHFHEWHCGPRRKLPVGTINFILTPQLPACLFLLSYMCICRTPTSPTPPPPLPPPLPVPLNLKRNECSTLNVTQRRVC